MYDTAPRKRASCLPMAKSKKASAEPDELKGMVATIRRARDLPGEARTRQRVGRAHQLHLAMNPWCPEFDLAMPTINPNLRLIPVTDEEAVLGGEINLNRPFA